MTRWRRVAEGVHLCFLGLWLGALVMIGVGAPLVFITLRDDLDPFLPDYAAYQGPHYLVAGGRIVQRLFAVCDGVQGLSAVVAGIALACAAGSRGFRGLMAVRTLLLVAAASVLMYRFYVLEPGLNGQLAAYWEAAARGEGALARELRDAYDQGHRLQRMLFGATALIVLGMIGAAWASLGRRSAEGAR